MSPDFSSWFCLRTFNRTGQKSHITAEQIKIKIVLDFTWEQLKTHTCHSHSGLFQDLFRLYSLYLMPPIHNKFFQHIPHHYELRRWWGRINFKQLGAWVYCGLFKTVIKDNSPPPFRVDSEFGAASEHSNLYQDLFRLCFQCVMRPPPPPSQRARAIT